MCRSIHDHDEFEHKHHWQHVITSWNVYVDSSIFITMTLSERMRIVRQTFLQMKLMVLYQDLQR